VVSQLFGAVVRAIVVIIVVATPSLLLPGTSLEGAQVTMLVALSLAIFVAFEYASAYPAIIEFRDAPPINRVRVLTLFLTLVSLCVVLRYEGATTAGLVLTALGALVGGAIDLPYSPVGLLLAQMPVTASAAEIDQTRILAGLAVFITLFACSLFALLIRLRHWPHRDAAFNVWVNIPNFDPTTGGDVVTRLSRDGRVNVFLALLAPFLLPVIVGVLAQQLGLALVWSPQAVVWGIGLWMAIPMSLFLRGLAMLRVAGMIQTWRDRLVADIGVDAPSQVV